MAEETEVETEKKRKTKRKMSLEGTDMSYELQQAYRILLEIMSDRHRGINEPFMNSLRDSKSLNLRDYNRAIKHPMWLTKIKEKFPSYKTITEVVRDLRLMLENCYRYYGPDYPTSKKGIKLEMLMEQKLALLSRDLREKTSLSMTSGRDYRDSRGAQLKLGGGEMSLILHQVRNEKVLRSREVRRREMQDKKAEKQGKDRGVVDWEESLLREPYRTEMNSSWELPQIGHFLYLCQGILKIPEVPQFELERILLMPREATLLARIMTALLSSPNQRINLDKKRPMSYAVWTEKLKNKIQGFYKCYLAKNRDGQIVFDHIGIEPLFYKILGESNPLDDKLFHELTFTQRIWLLKGVCDYTLHNHQTVKDGIADQPFLDQRDYVLGLDESGNRYLHFPQFCGQDLRIYRQSKWSAPKIQIPAAVIKLEMQRKIRRKVRVKAELRKRKAVKKKGKLDSSAKITRMSRPSRLRQHIKPVMQLNLANNKKPDINVSDEDSTGDLSEDEADDDESVELKMETFELIVDSVDSLRTLVDAFEEKKTEWFRNRKCFVMKNKENGTSPKKPRVVALYERLRNLLVELEPWESKLEQATKRLRNKLYKEWQDFHAKHKEEQDNKEQWSSGEEDEQMEVQQPEKENKQEVEESSESSDDTEVEAKKRKLEEVLTVSEGTTADKSEEKNLDETKLPNGAAKGLLLSHQKQNTASQAKELYEWETLRQTLVSAQKESEPQSSESPTKRVNFNDSIRNLINPKHGLNNDADTFQEQSLVSRRQSTLSIRLPNTQFAVARIDLPTPSPTTPSPSTKQILTLAQNSGMPKILADKVGPDAQFMHFHLGSPTTKKASLKMVNSSSIIDNSKITNTKADNQKLLLIPAVTSKGDRVYLKLPVKNNNNNNNNNNNIGNQMVTTSGSPISVSKSSIQLLGKPPPLAPIGSKQRLGEPSPVEVQRVKLLGQPPPLAQIGSHSSNSSAVKTISNVQTILLLENVPSPRSFNLNSPSSTSSSSQLVDNSTLFFVKASETNCLVSGENSTVTSNKSSRICGNESL